MINSVNNFNPAGIININSYAANSAANNTPDTAYKNASAPNKTPYSTYVQPTGFLTSKNDIEMYNEIYKAFATSQSEKNSPVDNVSRLEKLDCLLKKGVLLNNKSNDNSSVLQNLHKIITGKRAADMDGVKIAGQVIDAIYEPAIITQRLGDVPNEAKTYIMNEYGSEACVNLAEDDSSGTCVAASTEFHMASKTPAEFARWCEALSGEDTKVMCDVKLSSLSSDPLYATWLLKQFEADIKDYNFERAKIEVKPDEFAVTRAKIQDNYWDEGERTIIDVLMQSTLMQLGSQNTYNSLSDTVNSKFNLNSKGLIESEKTFIKSIADNKERTSMLYQNVDENQVLHGSACSLDEIQNHIINSIDSGDDVILGYVLTAEQTGEANKYSKNGKIDPATIVNGHEITVVDYKKDENGKVKFICNDTDDDLPHYVEYSADYLLPKIHHADYSVENIQKFENGAPA